MEFNGSVSSFAIKDDFRAYQVSKQDDPSQIEFPLIESSFPYHSIHNFPAVIRANRGFLGLTGIRKSGDSIKTFNEIHRDSMRFMEVNGTQ